MHHAYRQKPHLHTHTHTHTVIQIILMTLLCVTCSADDVSVAWDNDGGDQEFTNPLNWNAFAASTPPGGDRNQLPGYAAGSPSNAIIQHGPAVNLTIDFTPASSFGHLIVRNARTLNIGANLDLGGIQFLAGQTGTSNQINHTAGISTTGNLQLGNTPEAANTSIYNLSGTGIINPASFIINESGTLNIGIGGSTSGSIAGSGIINNGQIVYNSTGDHILTQNISGTGTLTKNNDGILTLTGNNTYTGSTTANDGILNFSDTLAKSPSTTVAADANATIGLGVGIGPQYYAATNVDDLFNNSLAGFTLDPATGIAIDTTAGDFTYASAISGTRTLTKLGPNILAVTGDNTYTGATTVNQGTLRTDHLNALGSTAAGTVVNGGATLQLNTAGIYSEPITINGSGVGNVGALTTTGDNKLLGAPLTLGSDASIGGTHRIDMWTAITDNGNGYTLTKTGTFDFVRSGPADFSHLIIDQGSYTLTGDGALPGGAGTTTTVNAGSSLSLWADRNIINAPNLILNNGGTYAAAQNVANASSINGTIQLNGNVNFQSWSVTHTVNSDISGTGTLSVASIINNQDLAKYVFAGNNTYSADTVVGTGVDDVGKMTLAAGSATGFSPNSAFAVSAHSTLQLNGFDSSIGSLTGSGTVENASATPATITIGNDDTDTTFSGTMRNGAGSAALSIIKTGTGKLTLNNVGAQSYGGTTTVNEGTLKFHHTAAGVYEGVPHNITINNGSRLEFEDTGSINIVAFQQNAITFGASGGGTIDFIAGNYVFQGTTISGGAFDDRFVTTGGAKNTIASSGTAFFNPQGGNTILFDIADGTDAVDLEVGITTSNGHFRKSGAGTVALTNESNNLNAGTVTIDEGIFALAGSGRLNSGNYGSAIINNGVFQHDGNLAQILSGDISGTGSIEKTGTGTLTLSGNNSYTGSLIANIGTTIIQNTLGTPGEVHIASGATLDVQALGDFAPGTIFSGNGLIDANGNTLDLTSSTVAPGNSPGTTNFNATINGLNYDWELYDGDAATGGVGGGWDLITVTGAYNITATDTLNISGIIDLLDPSTPGVPPNLIVKDKITGPLTILTATGGFGGTGDPNDITVNFGNLAGLGLTYTLLTNGNNLELTLTSTIPEPGTWALFGLLACGVAYGMRRRRIS